MFSLINDLRHAVSDVQQLVVKNVAPNIMKKLLRRRRVQVHLSVTVRPNVETNVAFIVHKNAAVLVCVPLNVERHVRLPVRRDAVLF